ncbi:uncharacterized protein PITG_15858 [Phytophthora infestans T30-4]|uniref:Uncharacterized protein n=1 Tax=Phytophthora infestans (strain T30-4) TaxID=403677 RepID=D0NRW7_PHYIT|nr:uncharacterized protein PITG_15858 [Phytophthora infestans T30-4]EEY63508.1 conserved hypothetical protein [Phytophthora infestans T30-4]|eukprot:XP_002898095.1 conserved hypothetical protein [Phytophthora infestans T30-4]
MATNENPPKRSNYGKCQYKTGKCFNERTLKRNGEAHSLCEEHRVKQNLIQRRSDRKYQTVHAIRRRERSQRRAVLKKQVSMAVAQQLFYEHQQQKTMGTPLLQHLPLHMVSVDAPAMTGTMDLAPPIQVPTHGYGQSGMGSPLVLSVQHQSGHTEDNSYNKVSSGTKDESTPTGIDDIMTGSFLTIPMRGIHSIPALKDEEIGDISSLGDSFGYMPIVSCSDDKETWSDDDIEFLQTILLA